MKCPTALNLLSSIFICSICLTLLSSCTHWERNVTVNGIHFNKISRSESGTIIGHTSRDEKIGTIVCKQGWVHFDDDMNLKFCAVKEPIQYKGNTIPADTWIRMDQDQNIYLCAFPQNTMIQNHLCKGTGGPKGYQTSFFNSGKLKSFFASEIVEIDGIPCKASGTAIISLHENGGLKECTLAKDSIINSTQFNANTKIKLDKSGTLITH